MMMMMMMIIIIIIIEEEEKCGLCLLMVINSCYLTFYQLYKFGCP